MRIIDADAVERLVKDFGKKRNRQRPFGMDRRNS